MNTTPNGWTKEKIVRLIDTNDRAVARALIQIYHRQTADEQRSHATSEANSMGFTAYDAAILTDIAKKCIQYGALRGGQLDLVRKRIKKYWRQLLEIAAQSTVTPKEN